MEEVVEEVKWLRMREWVLGRAGDELGGRSMWQ